MNTRRMSSTEAHAYPIRISFDAERLSYFALCKKKFTDRVLSIYRYIRSVSGNILEIYLYIPIICKSLSEQRFIEF
jgi:hypothetical protein